MKIYPNIRLPNHIFLKAGDVSLKIGNNKKALSFFNKIKTDFPKSAEADLIDIKIEQSK